MIAARRGTKRAHNNDPDANSTQPSSSASSSSSSSSASAASLSNDADGEDDELSQISQHGEQVADKLKGDGNFTNACESH